MRIRDVMVTDVTVVARARRRDPRTTPVSTVMSTDLFCCSPGDEIEDVLREMERHQLRRMPVCDAERRLVGVVTRSDIERARSDADPLRHGRE